MTFSRIFVGTLVGAGLAGLVGLHGAAPATAMTPAEQSAAPFDVAVAVKKDWRADIKREVIGEGEWTWTLEYVEKSGKTLVIGLVFRNGAPDKRPLFLEADYRSKIVLTDDANGQTYPLLSVEGITDADTNFVERNKSRRATFTFAYPKGSEKVHFNSAWVTLMTQGAEAVIEVEFPIDLPPKGAKFVG